MQIKIGGIYKHYKGNKYQVICLAKHSETLEEMIVYKALYLDEKGIEQIWVRPLEVFIQKVNIDGKEIPRFKLI